MRGVIWMAIIAGCSATGHRRSPVESVPITPAPAPTAAPKPSEPIVTDEGNVEHCHCFAPETGGTKPECIAPVCRCYAAGTPLCPDGYVQGSALPCGEPGGGKWTGMKCEGYAGGALQTGTLVCDACGPWMTPDEVDRHFLCVGSLRPGMRAIDAYGEWRCPSGKVVTPDRNAGFEAAGAARRVR